MSFSRVDLETFARFAEEMVALGATRVSAGDITVEFGAQEPVAVMPAPASAEEAAKLSEKEANELLYRSS